MGLFYIETDFGCGIRRADDMDEAAQHAIREAGTYGFRLVREATQKDIEWVEAMGGHIPKEAT